MLRIGGERIWERAVKAAVSMGGGPVRIVAEVEMAAGCDKGKITSML
jgi:hypothetical protein